MMTFEEFKAWHKKLGDYIQEIECSPHECYDVSFSIYGEDEDIELKLHEDSTTFDGIEVQQYNCGCWVGLNLYFDKVEGE